MPRENRGMTRPGRRFEGLGQEVRRRHRTWMASMTFATVGWAVIWLTLCLVRWAPEWAPGAAVAFNLASLFGLVGLGLGVFTLRAKLAWILITAAPIFANASLLSLRVVVPDLFEHGTAADPEQREARLGTPFREQPSPGACSRAA